MAATASSTSRFVVRTPSPALAPFDKLVATLAAMIEDTDSVMALANKIKEEVLDPLQANLHGLGSHSPSTITKKPPTEKQLAAYSVTAAKAAIYSFSGKVISWDDTLKAYKAPPDQQSAFMAQLVTIQRAAPKKTEYQPAYDQINAYVGQSMTRKQLSKIVADAFSLDPTARTSLLL